MPVIVGVALSVLVITAVTAPEAVGFDAKKKPKPVALSNEQIAAALLALDDFPAGWAALQGQASNAASATEGFCNGPNAQARAQNAGVVGAGTTDFAQDPQNGPIISEQLFSFPTTDAAKLMMKTTSDQVKACTSAFPVTPPSGSPAGLTLQDTVTALSFPKFGADQASALRESTTRQLDGQNIGQPSIGDTVYFRKGNHVLAVTRAAASPDVNDLRMYVQNAYSKFGVALQQARKATSKK
jgi:hypothetical protein